MSQGGPPADRTEAALQGAALVLTCGLIAAITANPPATIAPLMEAPKPTEVSLSVVEEPPPPPPPPEVTPPPEPNPPPPPKVEPSPLPAPPPPPPKPRHIVKPKRVPPLLPPQPIAAPPPEAEHPPVENSARVAQQAPENHSAVAAYIGRLHSLVARSTVPPSGAAYRMTHPSGEVRIGFTLSRDGRVSEVRVLGSSGSAILDRQAIGIVSGLRYPPIPDDVYPGAANHAFSVPVAFTYQGAADGL